MRTTHHTHRRTLATTAVVGVVVFSLLLLLAGANPFALAATIAFGSFVGGLARRPR